MTKTELRSSSKQACTNGGTNGRRFRRIGEGLFRYLPTNKIYGTTRRADGHRVWRNLGTEDKQEARVQLAKWAAQVAGESTGALKQLNGQTPTLDDLLIEYDKTLNGYAEGTRKVRRYLLGVIRRTWNHGIKVPVRSLALGHLRTWLATLGLRKVGQQNYARVLRGMFALAVDLNWIENSPAKGLHVGCAEQPQRLTPDWQTALRIVNSVKRPESREMLTFMLLAGLGQGEASALTGECFDLEQGVIHVRRLKTQRTYTVPIFPHLKVLLNRLKKHGRLIPGGQVFSIRSPHEALNAACARLGMPKYSARSLRRAFIVHALERGCDPRLIAAWQGHSDNGALLLKTYSRFINQDHSRRMASLLS
jgi:integrase